MPKLKTRKAVTKRFKITKKGKVKSARASKGHLLTKKSRKQKRFLSQNMILGKIQTKKIKAMLPYS